MQANNNYRNTKQNIKTAKGRSNSSVNWITRHINDPYVHLAKKHGYLSRAAFKLTEIDDKYNITSNACVILDVGAAPGGWLQVLQQRKKAGAQLIGVDLLDISLNLEGLKFINGSFLDEHVQEMIMSHANNKLDLILSDMAASASGNRDLDHLKNAELVWAAVYFTEKYLSKNGNLVFKMIRGREEQEILKKCKSMFKMAKIFKPKSSYSSSSEIYVVCINYKLGK